jgi:hypothetical protein
VLAAQEYLAAEEARRAVIGANDRSVDGAPRTVN